MPEKVRRVTFEWSHEDEALLREASPEFVVYAGHCIYDAIEDTRPAPEVVLSDKPLQGGGSIRS